MINNNGGQHTVLDWITRITPIRAQGPGRGGGCQCVVMRAWSQAFSSGSSPVRDPLAASVHRFLAEELRYCRCDICGREVVR